MSQVNPLNIYQLLTNSEQLPITSSSQLPNSAAGRYNTMFYAGTTFTDSLTSQVLSEGNSYYWLAGQSKWVSLSGGLSLANYKGTYNASTNTPTLTNGVGTTGNWYLVSVGGTDNPTGENLPVGSTIIYNGSTWQQGPSIAQTDDIAVSVDINTSTPGQVAAGQSLTTYLGFLTANLQNPVSPLFWNVAGNNYTLSISQATGGQSGYLSSSDWLNFESAYEAAVVNATPSNIPFTLAMRDGGGSCGFNVVGLYNVYNSYPMQLQSNVALTSARHCNFPDADCNPVQPLSSATSHEWIQYVDSAGVQHLSQPSAADLSNSTTGSGAVVLATSPSLTTPSLGAATATTINKVTITQPASSATLTIANGSTLATSGSNSITLTSTGTTNVTLPTSGTLVTTTGTVANANNINVTSISGIHTYSLIFTNGTSGDLPPVADNILTYSPSQLTLNLPANIDKSSSGTLSIGSTTATQLQFGRGSASSFFLGPLLTYYSQIQVNYGAGSSSGANCGLSVLENNSITGYINTNSNRNGWNSKSPAYNGLFGWLNPTGGSFNAILDASSITGSHTWTLPNSTGTIALTTGTVANANNINVSDSASGINPLTFVSATPGYESLFTDSPNAFYDASRGVICATNGVDSTGSNTFSVGFNAAEVDIGSGSNIVKSLSPLTPVEGIVGVSDGSSASSGIVGYTNLDKVPSTSAISVTNNTVTNIASLTLPAGDYQIYGVIGFSTPAAFTGTSLSAWFGLTNNDETGADASLNVIEVNANSLTALVDIVLPMPLYRFNISSTTTIYLNAFSLFSVGSLSAFGSISCNVVR